MFCVFLYTKHRLIKERIIKMKVTVCIGSSCHIKGSHFVVERLKTLIAENNLKDKAELAGAFCVGRCEEGVCVTVDDKFFSVSPETVDAFFKENILNAVQ